MPVRRPGSAGTQRRGSARQKPSGNGTRRKFKYHTRSADQVDKRINQSGGMFDGFIHEDFEMFKPKPDTDHRLRILPATWDGADNYGIDTFVHYGIGTDENSYLCLDHMLGEACPICEAIRATDDEDYAKDLKANKRVCVWVIDRDEEEKGPLVWAMPWTLDKDIAKAQKDKRTGEILSVDHPDEGYDIDLNREGSGLRTRYRADIARDQTSLSDDDDQYDEWMQFITDNPLPDVLHYYDYDHIERVFNGAGPSKSDTSEDTDVEADPLDDYDEPNDNYAPDDDEMQAGEPEPEPEPEPERPTRRPRVTGNAASAAREKLERLNQRRANR